MKNTGSNLDSLFWPKSVALIGASTKELSIGNVITKNLLHFGYTGPIYPINPKAPEIRGLKAYPTIFDVPEDIDLAHIVIPPPFVPQAVEDCGKKGVKSIIINTAGFKEMGTEGEALEKDFLSRAKKYGVRIFGPNCQGVINTDPSLKAYCDFTFTYPKPGYISIVAQSGGVGAIFMQQLFDLDVGMRMYASNGNACDVSIPEVIKYYGQDEGTRAIILYVETLPDPEELMDVVKEVAIKKPVLAMNAGITEEGAKAATSHTGGLAGGIVTDLIFKKSGILTFKDTGDLMQAAVAFATQPIPKGKNVGMITNTGGPAIIATDAIVNGELEITSLSDKAKGILKETMFSSASINNPLDVVATAGAPQWRSALDVMMDENQVDSIYINFVTPPFVDCVSVAKEFVEVAKQGKKPIVCNYMTDKSQWTETTKILMDGGIPCYDYPETAAKALAALTRYNKIKTRDHGVLRKFEIPDKEAVKSILENVKESRREILLANEVYKILETYGIPVANWRISENAEEAAKHAEDIGFPVVVKADSEQIIHKSDEGGVAINLKNSEEVKSKVNEMKNKFGAKGLNYFIQKFLPGGRELIIGAKAEEGLGHVVMFGLGGIYVELLKDVVFNLTPITTTESEDMLTSIKTAQLLKGFRGEKGVFSEGIVETIMRISQLVTDFPAIQELDLNPIKAFENSVSVVDARIKI
jgi:acetyltransferase